MWHSLGSTVAISVCHLHGFAKVWDRSKVTFVSPMTLWEHMLKENFWRMRSHPGCLRLAAFWEFMVFVVASLSRAELLMGSNVELRSTARAPYPLVMPEGLDSPYIHQYNCWTCTHYKLISLCQPQRGSDCGLQTNPRPKRIVGFDRHSGYSRSTTRI